MKAASKAEDKKIATSPLTDVLIQPNPENIV
jgi:hypothetical protein